MGLVVGAAAMAVALAHHSVVRTARRLGRFVPAAGGVLLLVIGSYVAYYGWWEIRVLGGAASEDPVVAAALGVQRWLAGTVLSLGACGFVLALTGAAAATWVTAMVRRHLREGRFGTVTSPRRWPSLVQRVRDSSNVGALPAPLRERGHGRTRNIRRRWEDERGPAGPRDGRSKP